MSDVRAIRPVALRATALAVLGMLLCTACASQSKNELPTPLKPLVNQFPIRRVWSTHIGGQAPQLRLGLGIATDGERVFLANYGGLIEALDLAHGRVLWRRSLRVRLSGGPGAGAGMVVVSGSKGWVIALSQASGKPLWRVRLNTEILSAPAVASDIVIVRGVDGNLYGLDPKNGTQMWVDNQMVPALSLRGTSIPILSGGLALCGFDNGEIVAVSRDTGALSWMLAVSEPRGNTQLQRLNDVDGRVAVSGDNVFAISYQGRLVRVLRDTGRLVWARDLSSYTGPAVDGSAVYVSTADGKVMRFDRSDGAPRWTQTGLERRLLTAPVLYGGRVVVADLDGVVHWLNAANGALLARGYVGSRVNARPVVAGGLLLVLSDSGELVAFRAPAARATAARR